MFPALWRRLESLLRSVDWADQPDPTEPTFIAAANNDELARDKFVDLSLLPNKGNNRYQEYERLKLAEPDKVVSQRMSYEAKRQLIQLADWAERQAQLKKPTTGQQDQTSFDADAYIADLKKAFQRGKNKKQEDYETFRKTINDILGFGICEMILDAVKEHSTSTSYDPLVKSPTRVFFKDGLVTNLPALVGAGKTSNSESYRWLTTVWVNQDDAIYFDRELIWGKMRLDIYKTPKDEYSLSFYPISDTMRKKLGRNGWVQDAAGQAKVS